MGCWFYRTLPITEIQSRAIVEMRCANLLTDADQLHAEYEESNEDDCYYEEILLNDELC